MDFLNRLFGWSSTSQPATTPEPKQGPKDFFSSKVDHFNTSRDLAWMDIYIKCNDKYYEMRIFMTPPILRDIAYNNLPPKLEDLDVTVLKNTPGIPVQDNVVVETTKTKKYDARASMMKGSSIVVEDVKKQVFDALCNNTTSLNIEGRAWTIAPNRGQPFKG